MPDGDDQSIEENKLLEPSGRGSNFDESKAEAFGKKDQAQTRNLETTFDTNFCTNCNGSISAVGCNQCQNCSGVDTKFAFEKQDKCLISGDANEETDLDGDGEEYLQPEDKTSRKTFECDVCNMTFSNGANMRRHKMRHTGVKPYECRICQKRFFRKDHLAEHFTTHSKVLPYHCPICNRGFQRQIAMRAHFQNEHVGRNDSIKSCPLCHYRASSMKCLRLHYFNRHGIDLDNPGSSSGASSTTSMMKKLFSGETVSSSAMLSDSGDSSENRSVDNATPPMHFLTPHVEISIPYSDQIDVIQSQPNDHDQAAKAQLADSQLPRGGNGYNTRAAAKSDPDDFIKPNQSRTREAADDAVTPSISLIPIVKQEPMSCEDRKPLDKPASAVASQPSMPSLIKVSPLQSLLRDDLRRKFVISKGKATAAAAAAAAAATAEDDDDDDDEDDRRKEHRDRESNDKASFQLQTCQETSLRQNLSCSALQCSHCRITFPDQTLYFLHKGCHSESNPWKCNICGEQCSNIYQFNSHLLSKSHQ
ncbi:zinc finger protein Pegasus [Trichogramma pretiosum]|uniref:zinc finger protein Pegasus n=1 Tax=Trichogramma pretiosum TaxID=7493 RepID=UPI0006C9BA64|nr:zinc finger protein Pegasus [Trichogramma pretiosum]